MPVQTAYAVPIGIVRMATASSQTLSAIPTAHTTSATGFRNPFDILSAVAHTTSNSPAVINIIQFILRLVNSFAGDMFGNEREHLYRCTRLPNLVFDVLFVIGEAAH